MDAMVMAFKAMHSRAELSAYARNRRDSSETNDFPAFPYGTGKIFPPPLHSLVINGRDGCHNSDQSHEHPKQKLDWPLG